MVGSKNIGLLIVTIIVLLLDMLVEMGIDNEIEKNYNQELNGFELKDVKECMYNEGSMQGYLFKCLHCGEHFLYVDCD